MPKRKREDESTGTEKKRKGFSVGPANLPDGTYRRKTQKIKDDLIQKAKTKKAYAKIKAHEDEEEAPTYDPYAEREDPTRIQTDALDQQLPANEIHPDRLAMLDQPEVERPAKRQRQRKQRSRNGQDSANMQPVERKPKKFGRADNANMAPLGERGARESQPVRFNKEFAQAEERNEERQKRDQLRQQHDKERRLFAKAKRPGKDGKQKLGRQGNVLLSKVQRLVAA